MTKSYFNIREALEVGTDKIVDAYKKATPGEVNELSAEEKKLVNQMYDKKGNLTPLGKKVMNHGKKPGDKNYIESVNEEDDAPASPDEAGMAMDQAKFIGYVADEIMEYIQGNNEFPEWMQNKLSALHEKAKGMHAVMAGKYESVEEARKYTPPTKAEIEADKKKDRAGKKRPSMSAKSAKKSIYKNMMGGLKEEDKVECPKCKGEGCDHCDGKGYHMTEAKQKNWIVTVVKPINKLKKGMKVIVPARNTAEALKKALKRMGENPAAIGSGHLDVKLDKSLGESVDLEEKLQVSDGMAKWIEDFQKSDAPQFEGKDKNERREMAIAAYLAAKRRDKDVKEAKKSSGKKLNPDQIRRALATDKAKAKSKDKVTLKKAPWDK